MESERFQQGLDEIKTDRVRGASDLARRCLAILADSACTLPAENPAALRERLLDRVGRLAAARPSMAPIGNLLARWRRELARMPSQDLDSARAFAAEKAHALRQASMAAVGAVACHVRGLVGTGTTVMTHSLSSTLLAACRVLKDHHLHMIVTESRPLYEGRRLARMLSQWSIATSFITEAQMGLFLRRADLVLVGADSILADGAVVNKAGTYLLALAAKDQAVPFYVCCESFKFRGEREGALELEKMDVAELGFTAPDHVTLHNVYFDVTPARLVTGWITEQGIARSWDEPKRPGQP